MKKGFSSVFQFLLCTFICFFAFSGMAFSQQFSAQIKIRFESLDGEDICVVETKKAQEPVFLKGSYGSEFHVRVGNTTHMLDAEQTVRYIQMNWE